MGRKAIIFGSGGQDGHYLTALLEENKIEVIGVSRHLSSVKGNVADRIFVDQLIRETGPSYVFHLAAVSTTAHYAIFDNHEAISTGTFNILESVRIHCPDCRVFLSGSAMQFKNEGFPINEQSAFEAGSPYSVSRIQSVYAGRYFRKAFGLKVYVGYFFNHDSPLRTEKHVNQKIVRAVQRIQAGSDEKLELGNIDVRKEFNFAGDIVAAVWTLVNQEQIFEVVIGSGVAYPIRDWLIRCFESVGKDWQEYVRLKEDFIPEYNVLVSDPSEIKKLGWKPDLNFDQLADLMMTSKLTGGGER